jgi:hypothetical protein
MFFLCEPYWLKSLPPWLTFFHHSVSLEELLWLTLNDFNHYWSVFICDLISIAINDFWNLLPLDHYINYMIIFIRWLLSLDD